jgi:formamidopyrimidine-DNA glycosylase
MPSQDDWGGARSGRWPARRRDQVRQFLMDKSALASVGNAYANEILFPARLHPKPSAPGLDAGDRDRLFEALWHHPPRRAGG